MHKAISEEPNYYRLPSILIHRSDKENEYKVTEDIALLSRSSIHCSQQPVVLQMKCPQLPTWGHPIHSSYSSHFSFMKDDIGHPP
jgi:hypothetical protein